jgi:hemerythrin
MPLMEWEERMSVGVREIDAEHRHLVSLLNSLFDAMQQGMGREKLGEILNSLVDYTDAHLRHEELLFAQTDYPDTESHKKEHNNLRKQVIEIQKKYNSGELDTLTIETLTFLKHWLINHTTGSDKRFGPHLNAHGVS